MRQIENFGRNVSLCPNTIYEPKDETEILEILNRHRGQKIRCIGRLHSWSRILETNDVLLDLRNLNEVKTDSNGDDPIVEAGAGCQIKRLLHELDQQQEWTLPSIGFITEQTVAGAASTGTHGSGRNSLSHYVVSVRVARYDATSGQAVIEEITSGDELRAARCSLGCLGVILSVKMQCRPKYLVEEQFREYQHLDDVLAAEEKFPLQQFYLVPWRWAYFGQHRRETEGGTSKSLSLYHWYRFLVFDLAMHILILLAVRVIRIRSVVKVIFRWIVPLCVIRHWRGTGPSNEQLVMKHDLFRHVEIELFVQRQELEPALQFLKQTLIATGTSKANTNDQYESQVEEISLHEELAQLRARYCHHYPICVRKILTDDTLISMASQSGENGQEDQPWYSITLTNYHRRESREPFEGLSRFLARAMSMLFRARPHWGKLCPLSQDELRDLYPAFTRFQGICNAADPDHLFQNSWMEELLK